MSDVPLASYLSAGIDSGMVTLSAAARLNGGGPVAFTGTFDRAGWYDEATGAAATAASMNLGHQLVHINAGSFEENFDDMIYALEEPRMGTGALPQYLVAKKVAETHKVVLTGHGGDELFSGYPVFKFLALREACQQSGRKIWPLLRSLRLSEIPHIAYFVIAAFVGRSDRPFLPVLFGRRLLAHILRPDVNTVLADLPRRTKDIKPQGMSFDDLMQQYVKDYLPGLLVVEDKISMAHALESRTPLLDNEVVAFSLALPPALKLHGNQLKAIPRAAARGVLPDAIFSMPKRGFPNPLSVWLRGPLSRWMRARLCDPEGSLSTIFDTSELDMVADNYLRSWRRRFRPLDEIATHRIFMLLSLESFMRQYREKLGVVLTPPVAGVKR
jgi:asparagine synthase (glutamine-hydrolysing)